MGASNPLDNPMWAALTGRQRSFAIVEPDESVYVVAVAPAWPPGWQVIGTGAGLRRDALPARE